MRGAAVEYLFITAAPLVNIGGEVTAPGASVRLGSLGPMHALAALGYDARTISVHRDSSLAEDAVRKAGRVVFGEMFTTPEGWATPIAQYRRLLELIEEPRERAIFSISDDHFDDPEFLGFYREALERCLAVTTVSERLAATLRQLTARPVYVVPEPLEGGRGMPRAAAGRRPARPLLWLARHAGVPTDIWRVRLLWYGYPMNLRALLDLLPPLDELAKHYLLQLTLVTAPVAELEPFLGPERTRRDAALRTRFVPWSVPAVEAMIAACDMVLIPSDYRDARKQAKSPNRLVAALHGGRLAIAHPIAAYQAYSQFAWIGENLVHGIRWALAHPRSVVERVSRGQRYIDEYHSAQAVARAWLAVFRTGN